MEKKHYNSEMLRTPGHESSNQDKFENNESGHEDTQKILKLLRFMPDRRKKKDP